MSRSLHMWKQQLRRHAERFDNPPATMKALADLLILRGEPRRGAEVYEGNARGARMGSRDWRWLGYMRKRGNRKKASSCCCGTMTRPDPAYAEEYWLIAGESCYAAWPGCLCKQSIRKGAGASGPTMRKYSNICNVWRHVIATIKKANNCALWMGSSKARRRFAAAHAFFLEAEKSGGARSVALACRRDASSTPDAMAQAPDYWYFRVHAQNGRVESGMRPASHCRRFCVCGVLTLKLRRP